MHTTQAERKQMIEEKLDRSGMAYFPLCSMILRLVVLPMRLLLAGESYRTRFDDLAWLFGIFSQEFIKKTQGARRESTPEIALFVSFVSLWSFQPFNLKEILVSAGPTRYSRVSAVERFTNSEMECSGTG